MKLKNSFHKDWKPTEYWSIAGVLIVLAYLVSILIF